MKTKQLITTMAIILLIPAAFSFAFEKPENLTFYLDSDFALYPDSKKFEGKENTHFSVPTAVYSAFECRTTATAEYKIPTPLGEHWLVNGANLILGASFELTPISIMPGAKIDFSPVPFLIFNAGAKAGTGWNIMDIQGMSIYDPSSKTDGYTNQTPFSSWYLNYWAQGLFQFDTGAVFPGDWNHLVMVYSYKIYYEKLTSAKDQQTWKWQCSGDYVNGLKYYQNAIIAYQMPKPLYLAGILFEAEGCYKDSAYHNSQFNGDFTTYSISTLARYKVNEKNSITTLLTFSSRRSFENVMDNDTPYAEYGIYKSREWYFKRLVISWHTDF